VLTYLAQAGYTETIETYLETWGRDLRPEVAVVTYSELFAGRPLTASAVVFADLERLGRGERSLAERVWQELAALPAPPRLLNRPARWLTRVELLDALVKRGLNDFRAVPLRDAPGRVRYPVFVRHRSEHWGALTGLLADRRALERQVARAYLGGSLDERLAVEFCDTAGADGRYRKYSAFVVGDAIVPRHLIFDRHWELKVPRIVDAAAIGEERAYLEANPHAAVLREVAALAGVEYGRFDYGVADGRVQVWEVNTNPVVMMHPQAYAPRHLANQEWFAERIARVFAALARGPQVEYAWSGARPADAPARAPRSPWRRASRSPLARAGLRVAAEVVRPLVVRRLQHAGTRRVEQVLDRQVVEQG